MAITQVGTATTGSSTAGTSVVVNAPAGLASGDVLLVFGASNEGPFSTLPSGFVQFQVSVDADIPGSFRAYGWYKVCGTSEPSTYTFGSTTASGASAPIVVAMSAWRGVDNFTPIDSSAYVGSGADAEPANPVISTPQNAAGRLFFCRAQWGGATTATTSTATAGWTETSDNGATTGAFSFSVGVYNQTADTGVSAGRTEPAITSSQTESGNAYFLGALLVNTHGIAEAVSSAGTAYSATVTATGWTSEKADATGTAYDSTVSTAWTAPKVDATATAYDAVPTSTWTVTKADATATAYDAGVTTSFTAGVASATATAYDAMGWLIHPVDVGAVAFNASVALGVSAGAVTSSVTAYGSAPYYGAPESRRYRIAAEDRSWAIEAESRAWAIEAESRVWTIPSED